MQQPEHDLKAFQSSAVAPRRWVALAAVGVVHVVVIWALATGLASQLIQKLPDELKTEVVKEAPPPEDKAPPPPPPDMAKPPPPFVPPPDINIQSSAPETNAISNVQSTRPAPPPPPAPPKAAPKPASVIRSTVSKPEYPSISRRLGEQGTVLLRLTIGTDGRVSDVKVEKSSGYSRLDETAARWIKEHYRFHPATRDGQPIESQTLFKYTFNLNG